MAYVPPPLVNEATDEDTEKAPLLPGLQQAADVEQGPASPSVQLPLSQNLPTSLQGAWSGPIDSPHTQQQQQQGPPPAITAPSQQHTALPVDLPNAQAFWELPRNRWLLIFGCVNSLVLLTVTLGQSFLAMAMMSGMMGLPATLVHLAQGSMDVAKRIRMSSVMAMMGLVLSLVSLLQLLWVLFLANLECRTDPLDASPADCFTAYSFIAASMFLVIVQAVMFRVLLQRCETANRLLNPVSSGLVSLA